MVQLSGKVYNLHIDLVNENDDVSESEFDYYAKQVEKMSNNKFTVIVAEQKGLEIIDEEDVDMNG